MVHKLQRPMANMAKLHMLLQVVDKEDVEKDGDEDGPMVIAINIGQSGRIGSMLRMRISISTESARTNKKKEREKKKERKSPMRHTTKPFIHPQLQLHHLQIPALVA